MTDVKFNQSAIYETILTKTTIWLEAMTQIKARADSYIDSRLPGQRSRRILYDGESQRALAVIDAEMKVVRSELHRVKTQTKAKLQAEGRLSAESGSLRPHNALIPNPNLAYLRSNRRVESDVHPVLQTMSLLDKALDSAQGYVEAAANRLLREGHCRREMASIRRTFDEASHLCHTRLNKIKEEEEEEEEGLSAKDKSRSYGDLSKEASLAGVEQSKIATVCV